MLGNLLAIGTPFIPSFQELRPFAPELWLIGGIVAVLLAPTVPQAQVWTSLPSVPVNVRLVTSKLLVTSSWGDMPVGNRSESPSDTPGIRSVAN